MKNNKHFISLKTKIMFSTLIPVILSIFLISFVIFTSLFKSLHETAKAEFLQIDKKHAKTFESKINSAINYLSIISSTLESQIETGTLDRELLQKTVFNIFDDYKLIDGSSIYFEPNMYDGHDEDYIGSRYGTASSGRICYYFYKDDKMTAYLPEALEDDIEYELPHYTEAKKANMPIYTEPTVYEIDGKSIPMFTLTFPIHNNENEFIGAVTVDLFLEELYMQLQEEKIYETGYIIIENDNNQVIYSPNFEDIGKTREEAGLNYELPTGSETSVFLNAKSIVNGKDALIAVETIYIRQLDNYFYIATAAPISEINAEGINLIVLLVIFSIIIVIIIAFLMYYLIGRISTPIKKITESANRIAYGDMDEISVFVLDDHNSKTIDEVHILSIAIKKMLSQLNQVQGLKLEALEMKHEKEKAEAQAQAKNNFLAKMSHEIRTPMNAVMGMTELILRKELPSDIYENALMIKSASVNLLSIINDILDFSKIESGMQEIIETDYMISSLVNDVISIIRIRLIDKPIQFIVNINPALPSSLVGDEIRIRQMLINILSNAVKYTNEGYISMTIEGIVNDDNVILTMEISDSGIGIKEEDIDKLFGDFIQIDMKKNKGIEGTGLGLAISRNLCLAMGGDITVKSEYGKGSVFTITLPQKYKSYEPFALIDNIDEKSVLLYETRHVYRDSIIKSLESLNIKYKSVDNIPLLFDNLGKYTFVFISSFVYGSIMPALRKLSSSPCLVLLADIAETIAPKDARILLLPMHELSIANILNNTDDDCGGMPIIGASFIAPEAKVLIVDDVTANLKVGEGLLLPYEVQVTLSSNGKDAIKLIMSNKYDLVFMDHMMPEMDGLEAVRHIRAMEGEYYQSLPIIALTANAVSGVKEMFIQNGMNDFLAKPIETAKLDIILEKWIPKNKRKRIKTVEQNEENLDFYNMLKSVPELTVQKALLVVGGSIATYERIVKLSIRLLPENITHLNELIHTDLKNYSIEVHGIKGVLNNIGAYELGADAYELEKLSQDNNFELCKELHIKFIDKLSKFSKSMNALIDKTNVIDKTEGDISLLQDIIEKLDEAVDFYDSVLALEIISSISSQTFGQVIDETIDELTHLFECFDFDKVIDLLIKLRGMLNKNG